MASSVFLWTPFLSFLGLTIYLSHQPNVPGASLLPDYVLHAGEFTTLTWLLLRALSGGFRGPHTRGVLLTALLFGGAYGVVDEIHQSFVPGREPSIKDAAVDAATTTATVLAASALSRRAGALRRADAAPAGHAPALFGTGVPQAREAGADRSWEGAPRVELLSRDGCHLCDEARAALRDVLGEPGSGWTERDITGDRTLMDRYGLEIPVVLIDGVKRFKGSVDRARLTALLTKGSRLRGRDESV